MAEIKSLFHSMLKDKEQFVEKPVFLFRHETNLGLALLDVLKNCKSNSQEELAIFQILNKVSTSVETEIFDKRIFACQFYLLKALESENHKNILSNLFMSIDHFKGATLLFEQSKFMNTKLGGSLLNNFFQKLYHCLESAEIIIFDTKFNGEAQYVNLMHLLINININNCLIYYESQDKTHQTENKSYLSKFIVLLRKLNFNDVPSLNLLSFYYQNIIEINKHLKEKIDVSTLKESIDKGISKEDDIKVLAWVYLNLKEANHEFSEKAFIKLAEELKGNSLIPTNKPEIFRCLLGHDYFNKDVEFGIQPKFDKIETKAIFSLLFPDFLEKSNEVKISETDFENVKKFGDKEIREHLLKILKENSNLESYVKSSLSYQSKKPNMVSEISDFEFQANIGDTQFEICIPIKSFQEFKSKSFTSVPVDYWKQIIRPFCYFNNCIVIFLTVMKVSLPFQNELTLFTEKFNLPFFILQDEELVRLFKFYNII